MKIAFLYDPSYECATRCLDYLITRPDVEVRECRSDQYKAWTSNMIHPFKDFDYDLGLSIMNSAIVPDWELAKPNYGWINLHPAPLPRLPGRMVFYRAIRHAHVFDRWTHGITCHYMTTKIDEGEVIARMDVPISRTDTAQTLFDRTMSMVPAAFEHMIDLVLGHASAYMRPAHIKARNDELAIDPDPTWDPKRKRSYLEQLSLPPDVAAELENQLRACLFNDKPRPVIKLGEFKFMLYEPSK